MARITVEDCLDKVENRFALVLLVAKRAKQLIKGDQATVKADDNKQVVTALREVADNFVYFDVDAKQGTAVEQIERDLNK